MADLVRIAVGALLGSQVSAWDCATPCVTHARAVHPAVVQQQLKEGDPCGWIGVTVRPMTAAFAESLGMDEPYGAIFDQPQPNSPAASADIEQGDVLTTINGSPLIRASDFAGIIAAIAPGTEVDLYTSRDGQPRQVTLILGSGPCRRSG
jgi:S1-C subfamily serine protease